MKFFSKIYIIIHSFSLFLIFKQEGTQKSGITDLRNFDISRKDALEISIIPKSGTGKKKSFVLTAATKEEAQAWVNALIRACQVNKKTKKERQRKRKRMKEKEINKPTNFLHYCFRRGKNWKQTNKWILFVAISLKKDTTSHLSKNVGLN